MFDSCLTVAGMWLLSRKPVDPEATQAMLAKAAALGLDTLRKRH